MNQLRIGGAIVLAIALSLRACIESKNNQQDKPPADPDDPPVDLRSPIEFGEWQELELERLLEEIRSADSPSDPFVSR